MKDLIYNQHQIPGEELRYGLRSSAATGCGWVATYNALRLMGYRVEKEDLVHYYERQLPLVHGNLGTSVPAPVLFFRHHGFPVEMECRRECFDEMAKRNNVCILFFHWRRGWEMGAHFAAVTWENGEFVGYNTFKNSSGPDVYGKSLEDFLIGRQYFGAVLIGIRDKR